MPYAQFDTAELDGNGTVVVSGPINFAQDEQEAMVVASLNFVLVQDDVFVPGGGSAEGKGRWGGQGEVADKLLRGTRPGFRHRAAREAGSARDGHDAREPPVVQTLNWSEAITITS